MNIKKVISFIALISFSWTILFAQTYEDSARITDEAETLQNDGEYQKSYDKSQEASDSIDKTTTDLFYKLMNLRINKAKNDADKSIKEINQLGASKDNQFKAKYDEAVRYFNEGNNSIDSLPSPDETAQSEEEFIIASNDFNKVFESYSNALASANSVKEGYLGRERATATKTIGDAKAKYNAALNSRTITAGDANGKAIASSLSKAEEALKNDNFASVQQNVAAALSALNKAQAEAKAKAERERLAKNKGKATPSTGAERKAEVKGGYAMTKEEKQLSDNFANNKGKLPYPVTGSHFIVSPFGEQQHQDLKYVRTNNNGIDIQTTSGAEAIAVFKGEVTRIFTIPGYNHSVIVRHGNYLTVYSNLSQVYVKAGDHVSTKQSIGKIYSDPDNGNSTILHFQLWKEKTKLNPAPWLD